MKYRLGWWPIVPLVLVGIWAWSGQRNYPDFPPPPSAERAIAEIGAELRAAADFQEPKPPHVVGPARVIDGDTIDIRGTHVRLEGISAPELKERGGPEARDALAALIGKAEVYCALSGRRSYEREVAVCFPERGSPIHGIDLGGRMVSEGWALPCPRYSRAYLKAAPRDGLVQRIGYRAPSYCDAR